MKYKRKVGGAAIIAALLLFLTVPFTAFADYVNISPPISSWVNGQLTNNVIDTSGSKKWRTSPYIEVQAGTEYTFTLTGADSNYTAKISKYGDNESYIGATAYASNPFTYIPDSTVKSVRISVRATDYTTLDNCTPSFVYEGVAPSPVLDGIEQVSDQVHFGTNGDFVYYSDNMQKHLMFYKYLPDNKEDIKYIRVEAVNNYGERLKYRIIGYVHGNEVFRSGLAEYGENIDIQNCNFDYYDIYLVNLDDEGEIIDCQSISSFRYVYGIKYIVPFPTDPQGQHEDISTTNYLDLQQFEDVTIPTAPDFGQWENGLNIIAHTVDELSNMFPFYLVFTGIAVIIWLLWVANRME